jgi:hypothetical protein
MPVPLAGRPVCERISAITHFETSLLSAFGLPRTPPRRSA